jgi:hypothetical protein
MENRNAERGNRTREGNRAPTPMSDIETLQLNPRTREIANRLLGAISEKWLETGTRENTKPRRDVLLSPLFPFRID